MRSYKTEGIIIKRRNSGEADRILTVFTKKQGKILVKAIGVRRITSRRSSHTELLNFAELTLYKGKQLPILTEISTINNFSQIKIDLHKVGLAYHLCELIDGLCPDYQENGAVFNLLSKTLTELQTVDINPQFITSFEKQLLFHLGFYSQEHVDRSINTIADIEGILERKLKTRYLFPHFLPK